MKRLLILSLALATGLIYSEIAYSRNPVKTLGGVKSGLSGGSSGTGSASGSSTAVGGGSSSISYMRGDATFYGSESKDKVEFQKTKPHPKRKSCAELWNGYYEREEINIKVSTRGNYDEQIIFFCPTCTDEEHFIKPFTESLYQGHTGMERIKSCGFDYAVFKGGRGFNEVIVEVPNDEM
ncbi:MAG: hypothetical protein GWO07_08595 [Candidatus Dadabacteria bacterium]|nr:hypothetical protein [Candidatus Dadabacteria bacterium]NIS08805.1 hypothetical protein [Candidatus Dadabacteria bacterium]NIY22155.1 hypothetical protein [Candidatus Dadabacteria bacterium]